MLLLKSLLAWLAILVLAVANGALREAVLIPSFGKIGGFVLSGVLLSVAILLAAYLLVRATPNVGVSQSALVGVLWLGLTLAFEFAFGLYVQNKPLSELLSAYTFQEGNIWPVVLLVTLLAPSIAVRFHAKHRHA